MMPGFSASNASPNDPSNRNPRGVDAVPPRQMPKQIGDYEVVQYLGQGGFGEVYQARDPKSGELVAIKVLRSDELPTDQRIRDLKEEAKKLAKFDRPGIVRLLKVGHSPEFPCFIVTQFIPGGSLGDRLQRALDGHDPWPTMREATELVQKLARILDYAHEQGIVHRDIKPDNILLDDLGRPYLADFGLVLLDAERAEAAGSNKSIIRGTPGYLSPEQARGLSNLADPRSDIYSLGVVLYELLTEHKPFAGSQHDQIKQTARKDLEVPPLRTTNRHIPAELETVCLTALRKDINARYSTALDFAKVLAAIIPTLPPDTPSRDQVEYNGLRSFGYEHRFFFLRLLPDWDQDKPFPKSVQSWKEWIENRSSDGPTSRIGVMHGPSGCGKSSLVKAGVLPHLNAVPYVYVEATESQTEPDLLRQLKKKCGLEESDLPLPELMARIAAGGVLDPGATLLIVLDQFEQWLLAHPPQEDSELVRALKSCDGSRLQCLLLVREEFWSEVTRLADALNILFVPKKNDFLVDLFKPHHAKKVLALFGRDLGRLPKEPEPLSDEQDRFLDQVVHDMAADNRYGLIVSVRLAMYAQLVADHPWVPQTRKDYPARDEVFQILRKTFRKAPGNERYSRHKRAATIVIQALLPKQGQETKGAARPEQQLRTAARYTDRPGDWKDLLSILDTDLRLITSTEAPEDALLPDDVPVSGSPGSQRFYQLTHDHVVRQTRDWLRYEKGQTWRGAAEIKLEDRADLWEKTRETRQIPTLGEWLRIHLLTKRRHWTTPQRDMMRLAGRVHRFRSAVGSIMLVVAASVGLGAWRYHEAATLVSQLPNTETVELPALIDKIDQDRLTAWLLARHITSVGDHGENAWKVIFAHLLDRPDLAGELLKPLGGFQLPVSRMIDDRFQKADRGKIIDALWNDAIPDKLHPVQLLCQADPEHFEILFPYVAARREEATYRLRAIVADTPPESDDIEKRLRFAKFQANAGVALLRLKDHQPVWPLLRFAADGDPTRRTYVIHHADTYHAPTGVLLERLLGRQPETDPGVLQALILAIGQIVQSESGQQRIGPADRKRLEEELLGKYQHQNAGVHSAARWTLRQLGVPNPLKKLSRAQIDRLRQPNDRNWYLNIVNRDDDLLDEDVEIIAQTMVIFRAPLTFPMGTPIDEPGRDSDEELQHLRTLERSFCIATEEVTRRLFDEFNRERKGGQPRATNRWSYDPNHPANGISWFLAVEFCDWLTDRTNEQLPEGERLTRVYDPEDGNYGPGMKLAPGYLNRTGYRLPTEAEREFAGRGNSRMRWCFGDDLAFLPMYASFAQEGLEAPEKMVVVANRKPNDFGLFDVHGNAMEWCDTWYLWPDFMAAILPVLLEAKLSLEEDFRSFGAGVLKPGTVGKLLPFFSDFKAGEGIQSNHFRVLRGGSFVSGWRLVRSGCRFVIRPVVTYHNYGFRPARTFP